MEERVRELEAALRYATCAGRIVTGTDREVLMDIMFNSAEALKAGKPSEGFTCEIKAHSWVKYPHEKR